MTWALTGTGMISSLGHGPEDSYAAFCRGESGLHPLRAFDPARYRVRSAYEIADRAGRADVPGRATRWLCEAIGQATKRAGLELAGARIPVLIGTGLAEQRTLELWWTGEAAITGGELDFSAAVRREFAPLWTLTIVNACAAGLFAAAVATDLLRLGQVDAVVVAAGDSITESMFALLDRVAAEPPEQLRPFDEQRQGVILGEGAAAVVIEPMAAARERGAQVLGVLQAVGTSCDAHHVTAPLREGICRAMRDAHRRAAIAPGDVDVVFAHGTGTPRGDEAEAQALGDVWATARRRPALTALKSMIGHTSGASGLMSLVTAVETLRGGRVPPTLHHARPIPELSGFHVVTGPARPVAAKTVQVNAFGFGGVNAVAIVGTGSRTVQSKRSTHDEVLITGIGVAGPSLEPSFDPHAVLGRHGLRYKDRASVLALCAAAHALRDCGAAIPECAAESFGVVVSSTMAVVETVCRTVSTVHAEGARATGAMDLPNASANAAAASIAIWFGLTGLNLTVSTGPVSGLAAVYLAANAIRAGRSERMLVVGVEPAGEAAARLTGDCGAGQGLFEGAAAVLLESAAAARERGAHGRAVVGGYGQEDNLAPTVATALHGSVAAPGLWLLPCLSHRSTVDAIAAMPAPVPGESTDVGEALAAFGVVQCARAATWLAGRPRESALLTSGGCLDSGYASLTLRGVQ